eukprot:scaffold695_cov42-Cyclotella_meneghiniana.AAC.2
MSTASDFVGGSGGRQGLDIIILEFRGIHAININVARVRVGAKKKHNDIASASIYLLSRLLSKVSKSKQIGASMMVHHQHKCEPIILHSNLIYL